MSLKTTDEYLKERRWKLQKTVVGKGLWMLRSRWEGRRIFYDGTEGTGLQRAGWAFSRAWTVSLQVTMIKTIF